MEQCILNYLKESIITEFFFFFFAKEKSERRVKKKNYFHAIVEGKKKTKRKFLVSIGEPLCAPLKAFVRPDHPCSTPFLPW